MNFRLALVGGLLVGFTQPAVAADVTSENLVGHTWCVKRAEVTDLDVGSIINREEFEFLKNGDFINRLFAKQETYDRKIDGKWSLNEGLLNIKIQGRLTIIEAYVEGQGSKLLLLDPESQQYTVARSCKPSVQK